MSVPLLLSDVGPNLVGLDTLAVQLRSRALAKVDAPSATPTSHCTGHDMLTTQYVCNNPRADARGSPNARLAFAS